MTFHLDYGGLTYLSQCLDRNLKHYCVTAVLMDLQFLLEALYKYSLCMHVCMSNSMGATYSCNGARGNHATLQNKTAFWSKANHPRMHAFSYAWSFPVTWWRRRLCHSICHGGNPRQYNTYLNIDVDHNVYASGTIWRLHVKINENAVSSVQPTSSKCVHSVMCGHCHSRDKDGSDTIRSAVA